MPSWGANIDSENKPKYLTDEEKRKVFADDRGWVYTHDNGCEEVIVAIGQLAGANSTTGLGNTNITELYLTTRTANTDDFTLNIITNEKVNVDTTSGIPYITLSANSGAFGNFVTNANTAHAEYISGNNTNHLIFTYSALANSEVDGLFIDTTAGSNAITLTTGSTTDFTSEFKASQVIGIPAEDTYAKYEITAVTNSSHLTVNSNVVNTVSNSEISGLLVDTTSSCNEITLASGATTDFETELIVNDVIGLPGESSPTTYKVNEITNTSQIIVNTAVTDALSANVCHIYDNKVELFENALNVSIGSAQIELNSGTMVDAYSNDAIDISLNKAGADGNTDVRPDTSSENIIT